LGDNCPNLFFTIKTIAKQALTKLEKRESRAIPLLLRKVTGNIFTGSTHRLIDSPCARAADARAMLYLFFYNNKVYSG
jgi:hypothetical protein